MSQPPATVIDVTLSDGTTPERAVPPTTDTEPAVLEPPRPSREEVASELSQHVKALAGPDATPRPEQLEAVAAVVADRRRTLLVARTGFGKSAVYFSATKMLRDRGWGPTVVISPLLALMRDQVAAAKRLGLEAVTINSSNIDAWDDIEGRVLNNNVDLLLIAPERLANPGFRRRVFDALMAQPFTLVCDEAHCISDWGHDFRPDYRRLRELLDSVPPWTPVLATTATANQRVTDDVAAQLGSDTLVLRTSLDRESLRLGVIDLPDDASRLAWLTENLGDLPGSGIIYCLTVAQAESAASWLKSCGHNVSHYTGSVEADRRVELESALRANELKALVATSALGMGFDKGDLAFCVHLGLPPSPVSYYQQIGRAGRELDTAEVIAMPRPAEDAEVWRWFESVSLPPENICRALLDQLNTQTPISIAALEISVNLGRARLSTLLNILEVDGAVERVAGGWVITGHAWRYNHDLVASLRELRNVEASQMRDWATLTTCRLRFLRESLDDAEAVDCGRCDRCSRHTWSTNPAATTIARAHSHLRGSDIVIEPRRQWPTGLDEFKGRIPVERQAAPGRALARLGDGGWSPVLDELFAEFAAVTPHTEADSPGESPKVEPEMVTAFAAVLKRWNWDQRPGWICPMPSRRRPALIETLAVALGTLGGLAVHRPIKPTPSDLAPENSFQAQQANSAHQALNAWHRLSLEPNSLPDPSILSQPVLLIDDEADSRWTIAVASWRLTAAGSGQVLPLTFRAR